MTRNSLGDRIRNARKALGLTVAEAASKVGLTRKSWERYELDKNEPQASSLRFLVDQGISATWLLTGKGNMILSTTGEPRVKLDLNRLKFILEELESFTAEQNCSPSPDRLALMIATTYEIISRGQETYGMDEKQLIRLFLKAAVI